MPLKADARGTYAVLYLASAVALAACGTSASGGSGESPDSSGSAGGDSAGSPDSDDSGALPGDGDAGKTPDGSADATMGADGGTDAAADGAGPGTNRDAMTAEGGGAEGGARDIGSCCSAQTTPGCQDPNLELCVCKLDPSCCTTAWTLACALIVQQKYCQPGVRDCLGCTATGIDAGGWDPACCTDWTTPTCDYVASDHCGAVTGCF